MRKLIWEILRKLRLAGFLQISYKGILDELGWFKSFNTRQAIDKNGNPIPWCTYSFIYFIEKRIKSYMQVFEYGSGNSTLWYSQRVKQITAVEHDSNWISKIEKKMPENAKIIHKLLDKNGEYAGAAASLNIKFDIIIIDGRDRNNCIYRSIDTLSENGVIIFDNSQKESYNESQLFLENKGFKRIDFRGLCPAVANINTTTIFYRQDNCLDI